jgi:hypothetical protein
VSTNSFEVVALGDEVRVPGRVLDEAGDVGRCDMDPRTDEAEGGRRGASLGQDAVHTAGEYLDQAKP